MYVFTREPFLRAVSTTRFYRGVPRKQCGRARDNVPCMVNTLITIVGWLPALPALPFTTTTQHTAITHLRSHTSIRLWMCCFRFAFTDIVQTQLQDGGNECAHTRDPSLLLSKYRKMNASLPPWCVLHCRKVCWCRFIHIRILLVSIGAVRKRAAHVPQDGWVHERIMCWWMWFSGAIYGREQRSRF